MITAASPRRHRVLPWLLGLALLAAGAVATDLVASARASHTRSARTQAQAPTMASLISRSFSSAAVERTGATSDWTTRTLVRLPVGTTTTVWQRGLFTTFTVGQELAVVVDPDDPGYAEIAGVPYSTGALWPVVLVAAALYALGAAVLVGTAVRLRRAPAGLVLLGASPP